MDATVVVIGRIGAPFGVKGWVKIQSFTDPFGNCLDYLPWQIHQQGRWQPIAVAEAKCQGNQVVARFEGFDDRESVRSLTNIDIGVARSALPVPEPGEYYWRDLQQLTVINQDGVELGKVDHLFETGANDVMVVKGKKKYLIPYLEHVVTRIDIEAGEIHVDWDVDF